MQGYAGRLLRVDLSQGTWEARPLDLLVARQYVGGSGLAAYLLVQELGNRIADIQPLGPENPLVFATGPLAGSSLPSVSRMCAAAISPLTGIWGESNCGGFLPADLKQAGWDAVVVVGRSRTPVILRIDGDRVALEPAADLWGLDTYETYERLGAAAGGRRWTVAAVGPAGERGVPYAAIIQNAHHAFGRTGMGAVMGSKLLKALVVRGRNRYQPGDPRAFAAARAGALERQRESLAIEMLREFGTVGSMDVGYMEGDVPVRGWAEGEDDDLIAALNGPSYNDQVLAGRKTCYSCPVSCKREAEVPEGPFRIEKGAGPEYETVVGFGSLVGNADLAAVARLNELCNRYGLDTISTSSALALAISATEAGIYAAGMAAGLAWGDAQTLVRLVEALGSGRSDSLEITAVAADLAEGSRGLVERIGPAAEALRTDVKGLDAPYHDPRTYHGLALAYATGHRGACHVSCLTLHREMGAMLLDGLGLAEEYLGRSAEGKAFMVKQAQDLGEVFLGSASICELGGIPLAPQDLVEMLRGATGWDWSLSEVLRAGERIWTLKRLISLARGIKATDDTLPPRLLTPVASGPHAGSVPDLERMLREYYELRGLDAAGRPRPERLRELGLPADRI